MGPRYRYHHTGIPTEDPVAGMVPIPHLKIWATDHESNPFGIQWMKYERDCPVPELVRRVAHVAFEVDDLREAIRGKTIIIEPNSPSPGVLVAFIEEAGAPIELLQLTGRPGSGKKRGTAAPAAARRSPGRLVQKPEKC